MGIKGDFGQLIIREIRDMSYINKEHIEVKKLLNTVMSEEYG